MKFHWDDVQAINNRRLTRKLFESAALMDIRLLDHIIVAGQQYLSMMEEGLFA